MPSETVDVERRLCISGGSLGTSPWILKRVELVDGREVIPLVKADSAFSRFVTGLSRGMSDMDYLDTLRDLRTKATIAACVDQESESFMEGGEKAKKRQRVEARVREDRGELPPLVSLSLPNFTNETGQVIEGVTVRTIPTMNANSVFKVEASSQALAYIREAMLHSKKSEPIRGLKGKVMYSKARKRWFGLRKTVDGKTSKKGFVGHASESDDEGAFDRAKQWAETPLEDQHENSGDDALDQTTEQLGSAEASNP